jgi:hypothetical protein
MKGSADHQQAVMGLPAGRRAGMAGVASAVVLYLQNGGRERLRQQRTQPVGAREGGWICHARNIDLLRDPANTAVRVADPAISSENA